MTQHLIQSPGTGVFQWSLCRRARGHATAIIARVVGQLPLTKSDQAVLLSGLQASRALVFIYLPKIGRPSFDGLLDESPARSARALRD